jgi:LysM domain
MKVLNTILLKVSKTLLCCAMLYLPFCSDAQTGAALTLSGNWRVKIDEKIDGQMTSVEFSSCQLTLSQIDENTLKGDLAACGKEGGFEGQIMNDELIVVLATYDGVSTLFTGRKVNENTVKGVYFTEKNGKEGEFLWQRANHTGLARTAAPAHHAEHPDHKGKGAKATPHAKTANGETTDHAQGHVTHLVKQGDTIYSIARTYNLTMQQLLDLNNRTHMDIKIGDQVRVIP